MKYDIICIGMALLDSIVRGFDPTPISASGYRAESGSLNIGGEAVNEAVAAAKLGMRTGILCALGCDAAGDMVEAGLVANGVDTGLILRCKDHSTPVTTMLVNEDGSRMSITNGSHRYNFHPERHLFCLSDTRAVILGSLFRAPFDDPKIVHAVINEAKKYGVPVFADTKIPNFKKLGLADLAESLPLIDFITPNEDEAKYYTGKEDPEEAADVFLSFGVKNVIVKLGSQGCLFKNKKDCIRLPGHEIDAVDATGAGDNFIAAFVAELLRDGDLTGSDAQSKALQDSVFEKGDFSKGILYSNSRSIDSAEDVRLQSEKLYHALRFGNACGAICTTAMGAGTALLNREQVLEFLGCRR